MPAPTLRDLAKMRLIQNINLLEDVGDLPYAMLAPILRHIQNPTQLLQLEQNCPQLQGETGEIWLRFIKRDIPNWDKKPHTPRDEKNWSKVYRKLRNEAEKEKAMQEEKLKEQMRALQQDRAGNQTQIIEEKVGYNPHARARSRGSSGWGISSGAPPAKTGKTAFDKLRRGMFDQKKARPKATQLPAHLLQERKGMVKQAPERLLRMSEAATPNRTVVPKASSTSVAQKQIGASPGTPQPASLPPGQHFSVPKMRTQTSGPAPAQKRRREEPNVFMAKKKRA